MKRSIDDWGRRATEELTLSLIDLRTRSHWQKLISAINFTAKVTNCVQTHRATLLRSASKLPLINIAVNNSSDRRINRNEASKSSNEKKVKLFTSRMCASENLMTFHIQRWCWHCQADAIVWVELSLCLKFKFALLVRLNLVCDRVLNLRNKKLCDVKREWAQREKFFYSTSFKLLRMKF